MILEMIIAPGLPSGPTKLFVSAKRATKKLKEENQVPRQVIRNGRNSRQQERLGERGRKGKYTTGCFSLGLINPSILNNLNGLSQRSAVRGNKVLHCNIVIHLVFSHKLTPCILDSALNILGHAL